MMTTKAQHSQVVTSRGTEHSPVARSTRSQVCIDAGVLCDGEADHARHGTRQEDRTWEAESEVLVPLAAEATRRSVSAGVIMRGGHCLEVWTKKQQVVSLSSAESELYAAVKTASEGLWIQSITRRTWEYRAD